MKLFFHMAICVGVVLISNSLFQLQKENLLFIVMKNQFIMLYKKFAKRTHIVKIYGVTVEEKILNPCKFQSSNSSNSHRQGSAVDLDYAKD